MIKVTIDAYELLNGIDTRLREVADEVKSNPQIQFNDLFSSDFMDTHTKHSTIQEFFSAAGYEFESVEAFEKLPADYFDAYVLASTDFSSWKEMLSSAGISYLKKKLDL